MNIKAEKRDLGGRLIVETSYSDSTGTDICRAVQCKGVQQDKFRCPFRK